LARRASPLGLAGARRERVQAPAAPERALWARRLLEPAAWALELERESLAQAVRPQGQERPVQQQGLAPRAWLPLGQARARPR
jgi:hypothetical protein